ncbi:MAG: hypothetical protein FJ125_17745, partial [Deltaproteobacteria bacterium]|nr:hypothetical protein [Deltaproteobacteria bacterium]
MPDGRCAEPPLCRGDEDCLGGRYCHGGSCREPCTEDGQCPGTRRCAAGRCPEADPCQASEDCDAPRVCARGSCREPCRSDDDCPGTQLCTMRTGLCREGPGCTEDADCLDGRLCLIGRCGEPCRDDDGCPGTRSCDQASGRCAEPEVCWVAEDCDPGRRCVAGRCTETCGEGRACPEGSTCIAEDGLCVEQGECRAQDVLEPVPDDDADRASPARAGVQELLLCPGEEDWRSLGVPAGTGLSLRLSGDGELAGRVQLWLLDGEAEPLAEAEPDGDGLLLRRELEQAGRYLLRIRPVAGAPPLALRLEVTAQALPQAATLACAQAPLLEPGAAAAFPATFAVPRFDLSCGPRQQADHVARIMLPRPALVVLHLEGGSSLALRNACTDAATEVACTAGDGAAIAEQLLDAGSWFAVWTSGDEAPSELRLEVRWRCDQDGDCPGAERCDGGLCHPACRADGDCGGRRTCAAATGHCLEPARCAGPADCNGLRLCQPVQERCFLPECREHADCRAGRCVEGSCREEEGAGC